MGSMYKFVKDSSAKRLFMQGTSSDNPNQALGPPIVTSLDQVNGDVQAVHTKKKLSTEVLGSSLETIKTNRKGEDGSRRITTRIVRKVTTLTRGEEQSRAEDLKRQGIEETTITKRAKVSFIVWVYMAFPVFIGWVPVDDFFNHIWRVCRLSDCSYLRDKVKAKDVL